MFEPNASWSLPAHLFLVSEWSANCTQQDNPSSCVNAHRRLNGPPSRRPPRPSMAVRLARRGSRRVRESGSPADLRLDRSDLPSAQGPRQLGVLRGERNRARLRERRRLRPAHPSRRTPTPRDLEPAAVVRHGEGRQPTGEHPVGRATSTPPPRADTLPAVSWVVPSGEVSEHPPAPVSYGQSYVTSLINAVMRSPDWGSTAIFLAWDDWGGFYDHVVPPTVDQRLRPAGARASSSAPIAKTGLRRPPDAQLRRLRQVHRG